MKFAVTSVDSYGVAWVRPWLDAGVQVYAVIRGKTGMQTMVYT
jgi:hypothetical protein